MRAFKHFPAFLYPDLLNDAKHATSSQDTLNTKLGLLVNTWEVPYLLGSFKGLGFGVWGLGF